MLRTVDITRYIRELQPKGVTISVGAPPTVSIDTPTAGTIAVGPAQPVAGERRMEVVVEHPARCVVSYVVGVVFTAGAALLPALRASRIAPMAALRDDVALAREYFRAGGPVEVARRASKRLLRYGVAVGRRLAE
mgnify:CR=1 FL=1